MCKCVPVCVCARVCVCALALTRTCGHVPLPLAVQSAERSHHTDQGVSETRKTLSKVVERKEATHLHPHSILDPNLRETPAFWLHRAASPAGETFLRLPTELHQHSPPLSLHHRVATSMCLSSHIQRSLMNLNPRSPMCEEIPTNKEGKDQRL